MRTAFLTLLLIVLASPHAKCQTADDTQNKGSIQGSVVDSKPDSR